MMDMLRLDQEPGAADYRPGVGVMLMDRQGRIFVGRRKDTPAAWQMPQGGIDEGETPREAALREMLEEIGTDRAEIVAESTFWHRYELPPDIAGRLWRGRWKGQTQRWFLLRFTGGDADIDLNAHHPEFDAWQWVEPDRLIDLIVAFKRDVYLKVLEEFRPLLKPL